MRLGDTRRQRPVGEVEAQQPLARLLGQSAGGMARQEELPAAARRDTLGPGEDRRGGRIGGQRAQRKMPAGRLGEFLGRGRGLVGGRFHHRRLPTLRRGTEIDLRRQVGDELRRLAVVGEAPDVADDALEGRADLRPLAARCSTSAVVKGEFLPPPS